ncbi:DNA/RNA polymerase [Meredithblackwellia eburnea MCA 4105]
MLRLTAKASRVSLRPIPSLSRTASTATAASSTPSAYTTSTPPPPPPSPLRPGLRLYANPSLPPLAPPLPPDSSLYPSTDPTTGRQISPRTSKLTPLPAHTQDATTHEHLAVLSACLSAGDIARAEEVAVRLTTIPPQHVHVDFIRAFLSTALKRIQEMKVLGTGVGSLGLRSVNPGRSGENNPMHWIGKAGAYIGHLEKKANSTRKHRKNPSASQILEDTNVDAAVLAVFLKGLVKCEEQSAGLMDKWDKKGAGAESLALMEVFGIPIADVVRQPVWDNSTEAFFGQVDREQWIRAMEVAAKKNQISPDSTQLEVFEHARAVVRELEARKKGEDLQIEEGLAELSPTLKDKDTTVALQNLRENLSSLTSSKDTLTPNQRQRALEESTYDAARQLYIHEMSELSKVGKDKERGLQSTWLQSVMFDWLRKLEARLKEDSELKGRQSPWGREPDLENFLRLLPVDKMALITIVELLRLSGAGGVTDGMKSTRAIIHVGKAIESEWRAEELKKLHGGKADFFRELDRLSALDTGGSMSQRRTLDVLWRKELGKKAGVEDPAPWTQSIRAKVGSILVAALSDVATVERRVTLPSGERISETQPAFTHTYQYVRGNKLGIIKVNPQVAEKMESDPMRMTLHPRFLPMVVPPMMWTDWNRGSYLVNPTQIMRTKDSGEQVDYLRQASEAGNLNKVFEGLDVLASVPWKINRPIFDVVSQVWNKGEAFADIPAKDTLVKGPNVPKPENVDTDPRARDTYRQRMKVALQEQRAAHSNRCDVNYKLEIARAFMSEKFYFPHNLDFRGRAYPIPPNLSHIGNDLCRGLLRFADEKPLGERGLRWLKIHLANMAGFDKASFDEREAFAMEHLEDIYDSADHPLDGKQWWLKADDPWQCLATCMELANALRSPIPAEFKSSLPVHQDGTCNGLQHYAALGGDLNGAHQVNLDGGDRPADVYSGVAAMANEVINKDAADGNELAKILQGKVTRKVVKQTVMTTVYGVTFIGAKKQIAKQLKERGDIPAENLYMCSMYLGRIVLDSIGDVFKGATAIQTWLNRTARLIAKSIPASRINAAVQMKKPSKGKAQKKQSSTNRIPKEQMATVVWTTPLGLPVVQPYRKPQKRQVSTVLQTVYIVDPNVPAEVDARAQATAFPPNFIHSLDATHMMMTALACKDKIAFASVHDSYWTHAASVDEMSYILRDSFIELHSQDILGRLRSEFLHRYEGHVVPVSKVPAGVTYGVHDGKALVQQQAALHSDDSVAPEDVIADLEREDGDSITPLFQNPSKVRRVASTESWLADEDDSDSWREQEKPTRATNSKFVALADIIPPIPARGTFDLERIRDSLYFFS